MGSGLMLGLDWVGSGGDDDGAGRERRRGGGCSDVGSSSVHSHGEGARGVLSTLMETDCFGAFNLLLTVLTTIEDVEVEASGCSSNR